MTTVNIVWEDPKYGTHYTVGVLRKVFGRYVFRYVKSGYRNARRAGWIPFGEFLNKNKIYRFEKLPEPFSDAADIFLPSARMVYVGNYIYQKR